MSVVVLNHCSASQVQVHTAVISQTAQASLAQGADLYVDGVKTVEGVMAYSTNTVTFATPGQHTITLVAHRSS